MDSKTNILLILLGFMLFNKMNLLKYGLLRLSTYKKKQKKRHPDRKHQSVVFTI